MSSPRPISVALAGLLLVIAYSSFVALTHRNITALFCAGEYVTPPPAMAQRMYQYRNSHGFDGQLYLYISHDILNRNGTSQYIDNPGMRWRRILIPGLAALLSLGDTQWVPYAYAAIVWLFAAAGVFLLARLSLFWGFPVWLGLGFLAIPSVAVSIDRMMTDIGLVLFLVLLLVGMAEKRPVWIYTALALAPLARETAIVFAAAWALWHVWKREWKPAAFGILALAPFAAVAVIMYMAFGGDGTPCWGAPFTGILFRLATPLAYAVSSPGLLIAAITDYIGAIGIAASFAVAIWLLVRGERHYLVFAAVLYSLGIAVFTKEDMWSEAYSYTRTGGPVAVMLALLGLEQRRWWLLAPMLLAVPRIAFQYLTVLVESWRAFTG